MRRILAAVLALAVSASAQDRTTATFGDWSVRCENAPSRNCEAATLLSTPERRPVAQLIAGRVNNQGPVLLLAVLPLGVHLPAQARLAVAGSQIDLAFQRCTQQGCAASRELTDQVLAQLRNETAGGQLQFQDGARQGLSLNFSLRGFGQALAALSTRR